MPGTQPSGDGAILGVYGSGGFGREVMPLVRRAIASGIIGSAELMFIDDSGGSEVNGYPVCSLDEFSELPAARRLAVIAVGAGDLRAKLSGRCLDRGIALQSLIAPNAMVYDDVIIGQGAVICAFSTITSNVRIGELFQANLYSYVAHDCVIGDRVTFAPGVKCNGNVMIGDDASIGTGAIIRPGTPDAKLKIGEGAVVGMGAVVTRDVAPGAVVVGNPARQLQR